TVTQGVVRIGYGFDDQAMGSRGDASQGHRGHQVTAPGAVAGVDDDRQVAELADERDRVQVKGEAGGGVEAADTAFAEDDAVVAAGQDVLGREQPLLDGGGEAALEEDGAIDAGDALEERKVRHVAAADLEDIGVLGDELDLIRLHHLADDRHAGGGTGLSEQAQALLAEPLEAVGGRAGLERAAAEHHRTRCPNRLRGPQHLLAALDGTRPGDDDRLRPADADVPDLHDGPGRARLARRQPVGAGRIENIRDARQAAEGRAEVFRDLPAVDTDDRRAARGDQVDLEAPRPQVFCNRSGRFRISALLHPYDHRPRSLPPELTAIRARIPTNKKAEVITSAPLRRCLVVTRL